MDILANVTPDIFKPLTHICNNSFKTGVFLSRLKIAKIKHIFKSGAKTDIGNYRPIYVLPQFSTNLEKPFLNRLDDFINAKDILSSSHYGFHKAMSTSHAGVELIEDISNATENKKHAIGVFIDLKKAFDTVDHEMLIKKLNFYGVRGVGNDLIKRYLTNREQFVEINGCTSELLNVTLGVPQGRDPLKVQSYLYFILMIFVTYQN